MSVRSYSIVVALLLSASPALADDVAVKADLSTERAWNVGLRVGTNFADMGGDLSIEAMGETIDSTPRVQERIGGGITFAYAFSDTVSARSEIVYSMLGAQASQPLGQNGENITFHYNLGYVRVPVLAAYSFPYDGVFSQFVFAGPEVGFLVTSDVSTDGLLPDGMGGVIEVDESSDAKDATATFDAGLTIGAGLTFPVASGDLVVDVRYTLGITKVTESGTLDFDIGGGQTVGLVTDDLRNRGLSMNIGYQY
jgi:hypothetical protein